jgi:hypothetical protein
MHRYIRGLGGLFAILIVFLAAAPARAQDDSICFRNVPGIGSCISGRFYEYWRQNGGLPVFGYPLTSEFEQTTPEGKFTVQYFERQRFEYHPEKARPYDVLLGRLGDEILRRQGRDWRADPVPATIPGDVCMRYDPTRHIVCGDFLVYWHEHGLRLDNSNDWNYTESLALWGLPLMESRVERNADGFNVETQWFERARFEYHPNNPDPYKVLIGRLGSEALVGVRSFFGGESIGHNATARQIQIESQRDGSVVLVQYTAQTQLACNGGESVPAGLLDRPSLKLSAEGVYDARGVLAATKITALC